MAFIDKIVVENPFRPDLRKVLPIRLEPGQALLEYIGDDGEQVVTILNGKIIPPAQRGLVFPRPGDQVTIMPRLADGDTGKSILRSIALIAVAIVAIAVAPLVAYGLVAYGVAAGIMIGGSLLVNAILPPPSMKQQKDSPSYSWSGPVLTAQQGIPIPKGYGKLSPSGNVISSYVKTQADKQYLHILICYGFGPARSIGNIKINGNPLSNYKGVQYETRLGLNDQEPVSFFSDTVSERGQNARLKTGETPVEVAGDRSDTQAIEVEFYFPKGIWAGPNSDSSYDNWTVFGRFEYKLHADSTYKTAVFPGLTSDVGATPYWLAIGQGLSNGTPIIIVYATSDGAADHHEGEIYDQVTTVNVYDETGTLVGTQDEHHVGTWTKNPANPATGAAPMGSTPQTVDQWSTVSFHVQGNKPTAKRFVARVDHLTPGQYDIRVSKIGTASNPGDAFWSPITEDTARRGEEMWLVSIREIIYDDFSYPNMVLLGIRALATDQLSGSGINVTAEVDFGENNNSLVAQDMMTNTLYGGGISSSLLDQPAFDDWEDHCAELVPDDAGGSIPRGQFNGILDTTQSLWEAIGKVCAIGRANVMRTGLHYTAVIDKPDTAVQLFSVGNILKDSFKETWLALSDRANSIDIAYNDAANGYERTPLTVQDEDAIAAGDPIRKAPMLDGLGITSKAQAFHELDYRLRATKLLKRSVEFQAPVEAIACQIGKIIKVQHDVPQWGQGGKLKSAADGTHVTLDRTVTLDAGHSYNLIVVLPSLQLSSGTASVSGSTVTIPAVSTSLQLLRLVIAGVDYAVLSFDGTTALVDGVPPSGSQAFALYAIDAIETRGVANVPGSGSIETTNLTLSTALPAIPPVFATYTFGEVTQEGKDFRITSMSRDKDLVWTLRGIEYNDAIYGEIDPVVPPAPSGTNGIQVSDLDVHEAFYPDGSVAKIAVAWLTGRYTIGADVYLTETAGFIPTVPIASIADSGGSIADILDIYFRVTYNVTDGESGLSEAVKVTSGTPGDTSQVSLTDRGITDLSDTTTGFNLYAASVAAGSAEPAVSAYVKILADQTIGSTVTISDLTADLGAPGTQPIAGIERLAERVLRHHETLIEAKSSGFYSVRVVGFDAAGKHAPHASAPTATISVLGSAGVPANVKSFRATSWSTPNVTLAWDAITDPDLDHYEVRFNFTFDNANWERATQVALPAKTDTSVSLTKGAGTYLIKGINTAGKESGIAAAVTVGRADTRPDPDPDPDPLPRGPVCFSPETLVRTPEGPRPIAAMKVGDSIHGKSRFRRVISVEEHHYSGPVYPLVGGGYVTPEERFWVSGKWELARELMGLAPAVHYDGKVRHLCVDAEEYDEKAITLENGMIAHNFKPRKDL